MTEGTSQGLFIVVAIVIFGIFTLMAYILFEDTLSPALASMFTDVTEQAVIDVGIVGDGVNLISKSDLEVNNIEHGIPVINPYFVRSKDYIPVTGNTYYTLSVKSPWKITGSFWEYTEDKVIVDDIGTWKDGVRKITIKTQEDTRFLKFRTRNSDRTVIHPFEDWELKLEVGRRATTD